MWATAIVVFLQYLENFRRVVTPKKMSLVYLSLPSLFIFLNLGTLPRACLNARTLGNVELKSFFTSYSSLFKSQSVFKYGLKSVSKLVESLACMLGGLLMSVLGLVISVLGVVSAVCRDDNDVLWINDSKATNVDATYTGLKGFTKQRAVVLLGGLAKVLDKNGSIGFSNLVHVLRSHRAVVAFGASGEQIKKDLEANGLAIPCKQSKGLVEAIEVAKSIVQPGDAILLSPGCASFDEFHNFEHRGQFFSSVAKQSTS